MYGGGKINGSVTEDSVNISFKKLTSMIGAQIRFQKDFLNDEVKESFLTFEQANSSKIKRPETLTVWEFILYSILSVIFIAVICRLVKLCIYINNMIFEKKLKKYRSNLKVENIQNTDYISTEPTPDIPPAYINFIYNEYSAHKNILIDSLLYLVNKGVYRVESINSSFNKSDKYIQDVKDNDLVFIYTGESKNIEDKHLQYLVKWLNVYDNGRGIEINKLHEKLSKKVYARKYVDKKRTFQGIIREEVLKKGYVVKIKGRYVVSNEFYNQWEEWKCYRRFIANKKIAQDNTKITPTCIHPAIIYGLALELTPKELSNVATNIMNIMIKAKDFEDFMIDMYRLPYLIDNLSKTFKELDEMVYEITYDSSDSDDFGSVSSGSSFSGGGGGSSGTF